MISVLNTSHPASRQSPDLTAESTKDRNVKARVFVDFWSGFLGSPDYLRSAEMTEVMMNTPSMEEIGLNPRKDGLSYQVSSVLGSSGASETGDFCWGWRQMWFCIPVLLGIAL